MSSPLIICDAGINHDGNFNKAVSLIYHAAKSGCKCLKWQSHIPEDEMIPNNIIPSNANETIWEMMKRCSFSEEEERTLKAITESYGMEYLSTPFSKEAVDRLERLGVSRFKVGSGELNNTPLLKHIVSKGKPIILSTGMNDFPAIDKAVKIIGNQLYAILHCVSEYPTPYEHVNLLRMLQLKERYHVKVGLSDHSKGIYTALAAVALGADVVEKHFTSDKSWPGADIPISIGPGELAELVRGADAIGRAINNNKGISEAERHTSQFAFASVVSVRPIAAGEKLAEDNIWVKRPGGGIPASEYDAILGKIAQRDIPKDVQLQYSDLVKG